MKSFSSCENWKRSRQPKTEINGIYFSSSKVTNLGIFGEGGFFGNSSIFGHSRQKWHGHASDFLENVSNLRIHFVKKKQNVMQRFWLESLRCYMLFVKEMASFVPKNCFCAFKVFQKIFNEIMKITNIWTTVINFTTFSYSHSARWNRSWQKCSKNEAWDLWLKSREFCYFFCCWKKDDKKWRPAKKNFCTQKSVLSASEIRELRLKRDLCFYWIFPNSMPFCMHQNVASYFGQKNRIFLKYTGFS